MMQIHKIQTRRVNIYLIHDNQSGLLVDVGARKYLPAVYAAVRNNGLKPTDIKQIFLTHTHYDHVDGLREIKAHTGAKVMVHAAEAEALSAGYTQIPDGTNFYGRLLSFLGRNIVPFIGSYEPVKADEVISRDQTTEPVCSGCRILHTPGHTAGSMSLVVNNKHAFVGDCMFGIFRKTIFPPFADDLPVLLQSWKKLLDTGCSLFYPGHGKTISREKLEQEYSVRISRQQP